MAAGVNIRPISADPSPVTWIFIFFMQDAHSQAERVRAAMASSLNQQRASVQRQAESTHTAPSHVIPFEFRPVMFQSPSILMPPCDPVPQPQLSQIIDDAAEREGVDPGLIREVARQESAFRPCAVSIKGAQGVMQLMPATQIQLGVGNPFDPGESIEAGTKLLKQLIDRYHGDITLALSAYNAGPGRVDKTGGIPEIPETKNYVSNILSRFLQ